MERGRLTILVILGFLLIMLPSQLRPLGEVVLGRGVCHFAVELDDFGAEGEVRGCLAGLRGREFGVEQP